MRSSRSRSASTPQSRSRSTTGMCWRAAARSRRRELVRSRAMNPETALAAATTGSLEDRFARYQRLTVRQKKRWLEILLSFEVKNTYEVFDEHGAPALRVREQGRGFLSLLKRLFIGTLRPFHVLVSDVAS